MPQFSDKNSRAPRVIENLRVKLDYDSIAAFIAGFGRQLTRGGMFLPGGEARTPGSQVHFRLELRNGVPVLEGSGVVVWSRTAGTPFERARTAGVAVRFDSLDAESRQLVDFIVSKGGPAARSEDPPDPDLLGSAPPGSPEPSLLRAVPTRTVTPLPTVAPLIAPLEPMNRVAQRQTQAPLHAQTGKPPSTVAKPVLPPPPPSADFSFDELDIEAAPPENRRKPAAPLPLDIPDDEPGTWGEKNPEPLAFREEPERKLSTGAAIEALRVSRAIEFVRKGDHARAESELMSAIAEEPSNSRLRFELGLVYYEWTGKQGGDHDASAEAAFERAAELNPDAEPPLVYLGHVRRRRKRLDEAAKAYEAALARNASSQGAGEGLALVSALRTRRRVRMIAAISLPTLTAVMVTFALSRPQAEVATPTKSITAGVTSPLAAGQPISTVTPVAPTPQHVATPAVAAAPKVPDPADAGVLAAPGAPTTPLSPHGAVAASTPTKSTASPALVAGERPPPRTSRSTRSSTASRSADSGSGAAGLVKKGDAALRAGRVDEALAHYREALSRDSKFAAAHRGLGSVYVMQGRDEEASAAYKKYLSLAPTASDAGRIRGLIEGL